MNRGFILPVVLVILTGLTGIALHRAAVCRAAYRRVILNWERIQSEYIARAGLKVAEIKILQDDPVVDGPGDPWFVPVAFNMEDARVLISVTDLQSRINLCRILYPSRELNMPLSRIFLRLYPRVSPEELIDGLGGKTPILSVGRAVRRLNLKPHSNAPDPQAVCTIFGSGKININTAGSSVLSAMFPECSEYDIRRIITLRDKQPFTSVFALRNAGISDPAISAIFPVAGVNTSIFSIRCRVENKNIAATAQMTVQRRNGTLKIRRYSEWWE